MAATDDTLASGTLPDPVRASQAGSPEGLEAYGARWAAQGERFASSIVSASALESYGKRWAALGTRYHHEAPVVRP